MWQTRENRVNGRAWRRSTSIDTPSLQAAHVGAVVSLSHGNPRSIGEQMDRLPPTPVGSMPPLDLLTTPGSAEDDDPRGHARARAGDPAAVPLPEGVPE